MMHINIIGICIYPKIVLFNCSSLFCSLFPSIFPFLLTKIVGNEIYNVIMHIDARWWLLCSRALHTYTHIGVCALSPAFAPYIVHKRVPICNIGIIYSTGFLCCLVRKTTTKSISNTSECLLLPCFPFK